MSTFKKLQILGISAAVLLFIFLIYKSFKQWETVDEVTYEMEVSPTIVYREIRGSVFLNDTLVIDANSELISAPEGFKDWIYTGPDIDLDTIPHIFRLSDVEMPYEISKKANSDTIVVKKNNYTLTFLHYKSE